MLTPLLEDDPRTVGPYRLQNRIGSGGMGTVYLGFTDGQNAVAIKVAAPELAEYEEFRIRFRREVRAAQRVRGKAVAGVLDADTDAHQPWMATEYVEGVSLADAVRRRGTLEDHLVRGLTVGLADALVAIHAAGVVHRDLKPSNILLAWDGPKVIDFGIAHIADIEGLTRTGTVIGTLAWMAPEQMRGDPVTPAADVFAWAECVAFAATGRHPFHADTADKLAQRVQVDEPDLAALPDYLLPFLARSLSKEPSARPRATELLTGLIGEQVQGVTDADAATVRVLEETWTGPSPAFGTGKPAQGPRQPPPGFQPQPTRPAPQSAQPAPAPARPDHAGPPTRLSPAGQPPASRHQGGYQQSGGGQQPSWPPGTPPPAASPPSWQQQGLQPQGWQSPQPGFAGAAGHPAAASFHQGPWGPPQPVVSPDAQRRQPGFPPRQRVWNIYAVLSLVFALTWVFGLGSLLAVVFGYIGRAQVRARNDRGATVATAGIALGWVGIVLTTLSIIVVSAATG